MLCNAKSRRLAVRVLWVLVRVVVLVLVLARVVVLVLRAALARTKKHHEAHSHRALRCELSNSKERLFFS